MNEIAENQPIIESELEGLANEEFASEPYIDPITNPKKIRFKLFDEAKYREFSLRLKLILQKLRLEESFIENQVSDETILRVVAELGNSFLYDVKWSSLRRFHEDLINNLEIKKGIQSDYPSRF